jgi:hypothetical protein
MTFDVINSPIDVIQNLFMVEVLLREDTTNIKDLRISRLYSRNVEKKEKLSVMSAVHIGTEKKKTTNN